MGKGPIPLVPWATGVPGESPRGLREVCTKARGTVRGSGNWLCGLTRFAGELPQDTHPQHLCLYLLVSSIRLPSLSFQSVNQCWEGAVLG